MVWPDFGPKGGGFLDGDVLVLLPQGPSNSVFFKVSKIIYDFLYFRAFGEKSSLMDHYSSSKSYEEVSKKKVVTVHFGGFFGG